MVGIRETNLAESAELAYVRGLADIGGGVLVSRRQSAADFASQFVELDTQTLSVPSNYATLAAALEYLQGKRVARGALITVSLAAGTGSSAHVVSDNLQLAHPDGDRILIQGATLTGANPVPGDFAQTGNDASARLSDLSANLTFLRSRFRTEIKVASGKSLSVSDGAIQLSRLLITNAGGGSATLLQGIDGRIFTAGPVALAGAGGLGYFGRGGFLQLGSSGPFYVCGSGNHGLQVSTGGRVEMGAIVVSVGNAIEGVTLSAGAGWVGGATGGPTLYTACNGRNGYFGNTGSGIDTAKIEARNNTVNGIYLTSGAVCAPYEAVCSDNAAGCGLLVDDGALFRMLSVFASGAAHSIICENNNTGIQVSRGRAIVPDAELNGNSFAGLIGNYGSYIFAEGATIDGHALDISLDRGTRMDAPGLTATVTTPLIDTMSNSFSVIDVAVSSTGPTARNTFDVATQQAINTSMQADITAGNITLHAAYLNGPLFIRGGSGTFTDTTPTAAQIVDNSVGNDFVSAQTTYFWHIKNSTGNTYTMTAGSGCSFSGGNTVANGKTAIFAVNITNTGSGTETVVFYKLGELA